MTNREPAIQRDRWSPSRPFEPIAEVIRAQKRITSQAVALSREGRQEKAIEALEQGLAQFPENVYFLGQLANIHKRSGDLFAAQSCLEKSHAVKPSDVKTISALGNILCERGFYDRAEEVLETGQRLVPDDKFITTALASVYVQQGKYTEARQALEASDGLKFGNKFILGALGNVMALQGHLAASREILERAHHLHPADTYIANSLGTVCAELGEYDAAERVLRRAQKAEPGNKFVLASLGKIYAHQRKYAEAETLLLAGRRFHPADLPIINSLGLLYVHQGRHDLAAQTLDAGLGIDPGNIALITTLGHVHLKRRDYTAFDNLVAETETLEERDDSFVYLLAKGAFVSSRSALAKGHAKELFSLRGENDPQAAALYMACCRDLSGGIAMDDPLVERMKGIFGPVGFKDIRLHAMELMTDPRKLDRLDARFSRGGTFVMARAKRKPLNTDALVALGMAALLVVTSLGLPNAVLGALANNPLGDPHAMSMLSNASLASVLSLCHRVKSRDR